MPDINDSYSHREEYCGFELRGRYVPNSEVERYDYRLSVLGPVPKPGEPERMHFVAVASKYGTDLGLEEELRDHAIEIAKKRIDQKNYEIGGEYSDLYS